MSSIIVMLCENLNVPTIHGVKLFADWNQRRIQSQIPWITGPLPTPRQSGGIPPDYYPETNPSGSDTGMQTVFCDTLKLHPINNPAYPTNCYQLSPNPPWDFLSLKTICESKWKQQSTLFNCIPEGIQWCLWCRNLGWLNPIILLREQDTP